MKWDLSQECKLGSIFKKSINVIHHVNKGGKNPPLIPSIDTAKAFIKIQHPFPIKTLKLEMEGNFLNLKKSISHKK